MWWLLGCVWIIWVIFKFWLVEKDVVEYGVWIEVVFYCCRWSVFYFVLVSFIIMKSLICGLSCVSGL